MEFSLRNWYKNITFRASLIIGSLIFFVGLLVSVLMYQQISGLFLETKKDELLNDVISDSERVSLLFSLSQITIQQVADAEDVKKYLVDESPEEKDHVLQHLNNFNIHGRFDSVYILDKDGNTLISTDRSFEGDNYSYRQYYKGPISGAPTIDSAVGSTSGVVGYYFSHPILHPDHKDQVNGVAVVKLSGAKLSELAFKNYSHPFMLIDENGVITYTNEVEFNLKSLPNLSEDITESKAFKQKYSNKIIESVNLEKLWGKIQNYSQPFIYHDNNTETNKNVYFSVSRIADTKYMIMESFDASVPISLSRREAREHSYLIVIGVLTSIVVVMIIIRQITLPIREINEAAKGIAAGKKHTFENVSNDEWQVLRDNIILMQNKILQNKKNLNKTIKEKTKSLEEKIEELEKFNKLTVDRELKIRELKEKLKK